MPGFDIVPPQQGFQVEPPPKKQQKSSTIGAFARGAERGALPAAGGIAGAGALAEGGALLGAAVPGLGETGISEAIGAGLGGLTGAFGGGAAIQKAQDYALSKVPESFKRAFGLDAATQAADTSQHPYASFAGELAPNLAAFSPFGAERAAAGAPRLVKAAMHPITQRAVPAATFGGIEAGEEYSDKGKIDPGKVAIAAGAGALANKPTRIGRALQGPGERAAQAFVKAFGVHAPAIEVHRPTAEGAAAEKGVRAGKAGQRAADIGADVEINGKKLKQSEASAAAKKAKTDAAIKRATDVGATVTVDGKVIKPGHAVAKTFGAPEGAPATLAGEAGRAEPTKTAAAAKVPGVLSHLKKTLNPDQAVSDAQIKGWDDDAFRLKTQDDEAKLAALEEMKKYPKLAPGTWENLSTEIEERLKDPAAKLSPEAQKAYDLGKNYEQSALKNARWIKQYRQMREIPQDDTDLDLGNLSDSSKGYVRRVVVGKGHVFDKFDPATNWEGDPLRSTVSQRPTTPGATSLSQAAPSLNHRQFYTLDKDGQSVFLRPGDPRIKELQKAQQDGTLKAGERLRQATMDEVEKANIVDPKTGEPIRYNKNWIANTIDNDLRLRRTRANIELLDKVTGDLDDAGAAYRARWVYKGKDGKQQLAHNQKPMPDGWKETRIPQLRDYYFPPHEAQILDNIFSGTEDKMQLLTKINRELARSLFVLPFKHAWNVSSDFYVSRGWDWITPKSYANLYKSGTRAMRAIITGNKDMQALLHEGAGLRTPDTDERNFYSVLLKNAGVVMQRDEKNWGPYAKSLGFKGVKDMYEAILKQSGKAMWAYSNMLTMTRMFELQAKGMPMRQAVEEAERFQVNYRTPPQIMKQTWLPNVLRDPKVLWFGRYTYGKMRILANMGRDLLSPKATKQERIDAAGKWAALAAFNYFIAPYVLNAAYKHVLGPGYQAARHGVTGVMQGLQDWENDTDGSGWQHFVNQVVDLSPTVEGLVEGVTGRDRYGRPTVDPKASFAGRMNQRIENAASHFGPTQIGEQIAKPGGLKDFAAGQIGAEKKYNEPAWAARRDYRAAAKHEGKDPLGQAETWAKKKAMQAYRKAFGQ